jgi:hypothetical protein
MGRLQIVPYFVTFVRFVVTISLFFVLRVLGASAVNLKSSA